MKKDIKTLRKLMTECYGDSNVEEGENTYGGETYKALKIDIGGGHMFFNFNNNGSLAQMYEQRIF